MYLTHWRAEHGRGTSVYYNIDTIIHYTLASAIELESIHEYDYKGNSQQ